MDRNHFANPELPLLPYGVRADPLAVPGPLPPAELATVRQQDGVRQAAEDKPRLVPPCRPYIRGRGGGSGGDVDRQAGATDWELEVGLCHLAVRLEHILPGLLEWIHVGDESV